MPSPPAMTTAFTGTESRFRADPSAARSAPTVTATLVNGHARLSAGAFNWDADLAPAIGSKQVGAVHSGVRKALAAGATAAELEQVVALAASLVGLPATVAAYQWVREEMPEEADRAGKAEKTK